VPALVGRPALRLWDRADALFVAADTFLISRRVQFATLATRHGIPAAYLACSRFTHPGVPAPMATHSISSSATNRMSRLTVSPIARAVFTLMTSSNLVGRSTGNSAGFAPLSILST
jgi:hypothetical protein